MKKLLILLSLTFAFGQDMLSEADKQATKLDKILSASNTVKFYNYDLGTVKQSYGAKLECELKKLIAVNSTSYFLQITKRNEYSNSVANIAEEDLDNLIEGLSALKSELPSDLQTDSNYMENKYITEDGLYIGYMVNKGQPTWFMKLEKYGSNSTAFIRNIDDLESIFNKAKSKIKELQLN